MKSEMKIVLAISFVILIAGIVLSGFLSGSFTQGRATPQPIDTVTARTVSGEHVGVYLGTFGNITFSSPMPESPASLPVYTGILRPEDHIDESKGSSIGDGVNVPSETDAPEIAKNILNEYGGLPPDAIFAGASTSYAELVNKTTSKVAKRYAEDTTVSWTRRLNGRYIVGDTDIIRVMLGDNGKLIWIYKEWRNYTYTGDVRIIPVENAIKKLENGDTINQYLTTKDDINIYNITLGYYATGLEDPVITLEPVWIFSGDTSSGSGVSFKVYARQFANFTAEPTRGTIPLDVTFTDTSDASPVRWYWDFGDGTNSTGQNPSHTYTAPGTYAVSLKTWNDLGSDTMEKAGYITVRNPAPPVANFTASPATGSAPLSVIFNDTSANDPATWSWTFGDGANASVQNPVHTFSAAGNYTISLNVTNEDGTDSIIRPDFIKVSNLPPTTLTTLPTTTVTTTTTTRPTTIPTPTKTRVPLSLFPVGIAIGTVGILFALRK